MKLLLLLSFVAFSAVQANPWCTTPHCRAQNTHVACVFPNSTFGPNCAGRNPVLQNLTPILQNILTDRHNYFRDQVASGNVVGFQGVRLPQARRMARVRWDPQLAHFASLNVMQCVFAHDQCRSSLTSPSNQGNTVACLQHALGKQKYSVEYTAQFNWAGQNLAGSWTSFTETHPNFSLTQFLMDMVAMWFSQHAFTRVSDINQFTTGQNGQNTIGHFTAMSNELQTHIGCAVAHYNDGAWRSHVLLCNYAFTNMLNFPVYNSGPTASGCTTGRDAVFRNLCTLNENINPNPFMETAEPAANPEPLVV